MDSKKTFSCRLKNKEISYLNKYWDESLSNYVHSSIKRDIKQVEKNRKNNFFQATSRAAVMLGFGAIFILFSLSVNDLFSFLIVFFLGIYFTIHSLYTMFTEVKKKNKEKT